MTSLNLLDHGVSCLGLLEEIITLFEWTKIFVVLFECLGMLEVNHDLLWAAYNKP